VVDAASALRVHARARETVVGVVKDANAPNMNITTMSRLMQVGLHSQAWTGRECVALPQTTMSNAHSRARSRNAAHPRAHSHITLGLVHTGERRRGPSHPQPHSRHQRTRRRRHEPLRPTTTPIPKPPRQHLLSLPSPQSTSLPPNRPAPGHMLHPTLSSLASHLCPMLLYFIF
jgi:hypothetical protein